MRIFKIALLFIVACFAVSCGHKKIETQFETRSFASALANSPNDSLRIDINIEYVTKGFDQATRDSINDIIKELVFGSDKYEDEPVPEAVDEFIEDAQEDYNLNFANVEVDDSLSEGTLRVFLNWEKKIQGYFVEGYGDYMSYVMDAYTFEGGANGNTYKAAKVFNKKTGKLVSEDDLFLPNYESKLSELLSENLHNSFEKQEDYDALFIKDIEPNGHFYVTSKGVVYIYGSPYSLEYMSNGIYSDELDDIIGPYYLGPIEVLIPWEELEDIIKR